MFIDVCNGDADGLCAVVQWRLHQPVPAQLVTGLKHDIELLERVQAAQGDQVLVCDISMRRNHSALVRLLDAGVRVRYFDHHQVDTIPAHPLLEAYIDMASDTCTSLLMNHYLLGAFSAWAVVGAFGDNLGTVAEGLAVKLGLSPAQRRYLQTLGEAINYNAYGDSEQDVYIAPQRLYERMVQFDNPLDFWAREPVGRELEALRKTDLRQAYAVSPYRQNTQASVYLLPDKPWSRRVIGSMGNALATTEPARAHALLRDTAAGEFVVSVRAPLAAPVGAVELCRVFGGDGRAAAAGIDHLPAQQLDRFVNAFTTAHWIKRTV